MSPAKPVKPETRKRTRKRKRRAASSSSSSSISDSSSSENEPPPKIVRSVITAAKASTDKESESDSDSESSDSSSSSGRSASPSIPKTTAVEPVPTQSVNRQRSPSLTPPRTEIPSFLPQKQDAGSEEKEKEMKDKFRQFWMSSVADGFHEDLDTLRKEPNLGAGRLALLIDSLASGAEVFSSAAGDGVTEMDVILG